MLSTSGDAVSMPPDGNSFDFLQEAFQLCNTSGIEMLELGNFLELCRAIHIPRCEEKECEKLFYSVPTMNFLTFQQLFHTSLSSMQSVGTNMTSNDLLSLHPDFLRRVASLAFVDLKPINPSPEVSAKMNRLGLVIRLHTRENKYLRDAVHRITSEAQAFRLKVQQQFTASVQQQQQQQHLEDGVGPRVAAELRRHIEAQEIELKEKQEFIEQLQREKKKEHSVYVETLKSLETSHETSISLVVDERDGLQRHVIELENTVKDIEIKLENESQNNTKLSKTMVENQHQHMQEMLGLQQQYTTDQSTWETIQNGLENEILESRKHEDDVMNTMEIQKDQLEEQLKILNVTNSDREKWGKEAESLKATLQKLRQNAEEKEQDMLETKSILRTYEQTMSERKNMLDELQHEQLIIIQRSTKNETKVESLMDETNELKKTIRLLKDDCRQEREQKNIANSRRTTLERNLENLQRLHVLVENDLKKEKRKNDILQNEKLFHDDLQKRNEQKYVSLEKELNSFKQIISEQKTTSQQEHEMLLRQKTMSTVATSAAATTAAATTAAAITTASPYEEENKILLERMNIQSKRHHEIDTTNISTIHALENKVRTVEEELDSITGTYEHDQRKWQRETLNSREKIQDLEDTKQQYEQNIINLEVNIQEIQTEMLHSTKAIATMEREMKENKIKNQTQIVSVKNQLQNEKLLYDEKNTKLNIVIIQLQNKLKETTVQLDTTLHQMATLEQDMKDRIVRERQRADLAEENTENQTTQMKEETRIQLSTLTEETNQKIIRIENEGRTREQKERKMYETTLTTIRAEFEARRIQNNTKMEELNRKLATLNTTLNDTIHEKQMIENNLERQVNDELIKCKTKMVNMHTKEMQELQSVKMEQERVRQIEISDVKHQLLTVTNNLNTTTLHLKTIENDKNNSIMNNQQLKRNVETMKIEKKKLIHNYDQIIDQLNQDVMKKKKIIDRDHQKILELTMLYEHEQTKYNDMELMKKDEQNEMRRIKEKLNDMNAKILSLSNQLAINENMKKRVENDFKMEQEEHQHDLTMLEVERQNKHEAETICNKKMIEIDALQYKLDNVQNFLTTEKKDNKMNQERYVEEQKKIIQERDDISKKYYGLKENMKELQTICREEVTSLSQLLKDQEAQRQNIENEKNRLQHQYQEMTVEMTKKADEIVEMEFTLNEREKKMKVDLIQRKNEEESLHMTHMNIEKRLEQSTTAMSNIMNKLNNEKEKSLILENENNVFTMKLKTYQHQSEERIQQMKENMTAANLKYSQLLNEMNNNVNISHLKEKELIQKYQSDIMYEKSNRISTEAKLLSLKEKLNQTETSLNSSKNRIQSLETSLQSTSVLVNEDILKYDQMSHTKKTLELRVSALETTISISNETEKRLRKNNSMLLMEIESVKLTVSQQQQDLMERTTMVEKVRKANVLLKECEQRAIEAEDKLSTLNMSAQHEQQDEIMKNDQLQKDCLQLSKEVMNEKNKSDILTLELENMKKEKELEEKRRLRIEEKALKIKRELEIASSELNLETSMRNELNGIRNEFKSFLNQSKNVVSGRGSSSGSGMRSGSSDFVGGNGFVNGVILSPAANDDNDDDDDALFGRTTREMLDISLSPSTAASKKVVDDDNSTSIHISRRGSIRVHTSPKRQ